MSILNDFARQTGLEANMYYRSSRSATAGDTTSTAYRSGDSPMKQPISSLQREAQFQREPAPHKAGRR